MSVEFDLQDDGQVRVRVDRDGERAVSDVMDPKMMIQEIADAAGWDTELDHDMLIVTLPAEPEAPVDPEAELEPSKIDESAPPEEPSA